MVWRQVETSQKDHGYLCPPQKNVKLARGATPKVKPVGVFSDRLCAQFFELGRVIQTGG